MSKEPQVGDVWEHRFGTNKVYVLANLGETIAYLMFVDEKCVRERSYKKEWFVGDFTYLGKSKANIDDLFKTEKCVMNNLTEKWKKGELLEGFYYVRCAWSDEVEIRYVHNGVDDWQEIIAEVPSYEEWQNLKEYERTVTSYNMKPIDYDIACETVNRLLDDNKRLKHDVGNLGYKIKNQRKEIDNRIKEIEKSKELLKECGEYLMCIDRNPQLVEQIIELLGEE